MFWRVAYHVAKVEENWNGDVIERAREFYLLLTTKKFFPILRRLPGRVRPLASLRPVLLLRCV